MHLGIVIPTFNERENVQTITARIADALRGRDLTYEIWFIDDSRDDTPQVLEALSAAHPEVHYVHRKDARGLATAVVEGFARTSAEYLVVMDADLQHPPELLPVIAERLAEGIDIVIPSRFVPGGSDGGLNTFRKLVSWTARTMGRVAIRRLRHISDCTGGYFGLRRSVLAGADLSPIGWKILMEILVKGRYQTVHEVPYQFVDRDAGESKMSLREQWNYVRHIVRLVWSSPEDRRFYLFCFVGGLGMVVNLAVMSLMMYVFHLREVPSSVIASLVAMAHNFLWNDNMTWKGHAHPVKWRRALQIPMFMLISGVSLAITALFVKGFVWLHWSPLAGQLIGIIVATLWSYTANNRWTWKAPSDADRIELLPKIRVTHEDVKP
ncbi:glycosyltransferase family 2 protein [Alicyclobacillus cycloheptanicus]|uniref:Dolichol-phosphate mannosyltransferase n=1 Tax=Alicyclobacillus cycloheptanicus TaxID=1457 RepID=A0ABT9XD64_9BACL|nr:glycosyltransferase family 2 protein [Alicyclobacillus cycloheptanicus]MDQ0188218.1 dolichol-phosphate mannosyltransferase [Alicyclobacillus cycloheptanicus]WDM00948.1 glycosyltransferase family 2 protein [Alicyclobacillus cycloheptanicus]